MEKLPYTIEQAAFVDYVKAKVTSLFAERPVVAHSIDHISRVVDWTKEIALGEKAKSIFLCELAAWLHDIGRAYEDNPGENSRKHHELSYEVLRQWYREDDKFNFLTKEEKLELLYTVRYHWNNRADKYDTAWILRDADKMDGYGEVGVERAREFSYDNDELLNQHLRHLYDTLYHIRTTTAKKIIKKQKLVEPIDGLYKKYLKSKIQPVEL